MRTTGADTNGGGFSTLVTNMATDLAATDGNTSAPVVTSASYTFIARDVGHWLYIGAGTNWTPGWYQIASVAAGAATLTAGIGTGYLSSSGVPYAVTTAAGCATVASPTGGTWSIDYSQGTTIAFTDLVISGSTNTDFTSAASPMGKNFIGNIFNVTSGTGFTVQRVQVLSIPSGVIARADKSMGTLSSTGGNATFGGPLASPGQAGALKIAANTIFLANSGGGTPTVYLMTNSSNVSGGRVTDNTNAQGANPNFWVGWESQRHVLTDPTNRPIVKTNANSVVCFTLGGQATIFRNIDCGDNGTSTGTTGINFSGPQGRVENATVTGLVTGFAGGSASGLFLNIMADSCTSNGITPSAAKVVNFVVKNGSGNSGVNMLGSGTVENGIIYNQTGTGLSIGANSCTAKNITIHGSSGASGYGVSFSAFSGSSLLNVISYGNAQNNYRDNGSGVPNILLANCAGGAGGVADSMPAISLRNFIALTEDPFTDAANGDFSLNNAAGGGALLRAAGFPGVFPGGTTTGYLDIGAAQSNGGTVTVPVEADVLAGVMYGAGGTQYTGTLVAGSGGVPSSVGIFRGRK